MKGVFMERFADNIRNVTNDVMDLRDMIEEGEALNEEKAIKVLDRAIDTLDTCEQGYRQLETEVLPKIGEDVREMFEGILANGYYVPDEEGEDNEENN
jgi:hypothetical protein